MDNLVDKYRKICCLSMQDLVNLHKLYCLTVHPLWKEISNNYWKNTEKYWTPTYQVVSRRNFEELCFKIKASLITLDTHSVFSVSIEHTCLLELMEYYNVEAYHDEKAVDKTTFSAILAFNYSQFVKTINIHPVAYTAICAFFTIFQENSLNPSIPVNFINYLPIVKEDGEFLIWLHNNFTNLHEIQASIANCIKELYPESSSFWQKEKSHDSKKILLICRETFCKLLKLKNSEYKTKKILPAFRPNEKTPLRQNFPKCKLPVEGRSIKLQSPQSVLRFQPVADVLVPQKESKEYHPELYDTLIEHYKRLTRQNYSGAMTPEELSPRIYKPLQNKKSATPQRVFTNDLTLPPSFHAVGKNLTSKAQVLTRSKTKSPACKSFKRIQRFKRHFL